MGGAFAGWLIRKGSPAASPSVSTAIPPNKTEAAASGFKNPWPTPGTAGVDAPGIAAPAAANAETRLWAAPGDVQGAPLPTGAAVLAAHARNAPVEGRSGTLRLQDIGVWRALRPNARILLPLPGGEELAGRVNVVQQDTVATRAGGHLETGGRGSFSLSAGPGGVGGRILLPERGIAFEISTDPAGRVTILEKPLGDVICSPLPRPANEPLAAPSEVPQAAVPLHSSRPGAVAVLYLDFDGETVIDPDWNDGNPIVAAASPLTASQITEVWNRVREDYAAFNIDVTTDVNRYNAAPVGRRMRCIITPTYGWFGPAGGVAYVRSFSLAGTYGFTTTVPCWVFNSSVKGIAEAVSHEVGHTLGLRHDGRISPAEEYYVGHGSGSVGWAPIMGTGYYQPVVQWSKGEYLFANNQEDDLAIIAGTANGFGYVADDAGDSRAAAQPLALNTTSGFSRTGVISSSTDVDFFAVTLGAGGLTVMGQPATPSPNLDLALELQDSAGAVVATHSPDTSLSATLEAVLPAGTYYIRVQGTGRGTPLGDGYSAYGSIGEYTLTGVVSDPPRINTSPVAQTLAPGGSLSLSVAATGSGTLAYRWLKNGRDIVNGGRISGAAAPTLVITSLDSSDAGTYSVVVSSAFGSATSSGARIAVIGPPAVTAPPLSRVALAGQTLTFSSDVISHEGVSYEWIRNGRPIAGATGPTFSIPSATQADTGWYEFRVRNTRGTTATRFRVNVAPTNSTVAAWGNNLDGKTDVPAGLVNIVAVETGSNHSLALRGDGTVVAWGSNSRGQLNIPAGLKDVVAISAGDSLSFALKADGTLVQWGQSPFPGEPMPPGLYDIVAISAGAHSGVALRADGSVVAWGWPSGPLSIPALVSDVVDVSAGFSHMIGLKSDGTVVAWGGGYTGETNVPVGLANVIQVSTSGSHVLALRSDGTVVAWGANSYGQCDVPAGLANVTLVSAGASHSVALTADGNVVVWGSTLYGHQDVPAHVRNVAGLSARAEHTLALIPLQGVQLTRQPVDDLAAPGDAVAFSVAATGTPPLTYQWKRNNVALQDGGSIAGARGAKLTISNVAAANAGSYTVLVANAAGDVISAPAILSVITPPQISSRPRSRIITAGTALNLAITATGVEPLQYVWRRNGQVIAGATGATLTIPSASMSDSGWYHVRVTGADGGRANSVAHVAVSPFPANAYSVVAWGFNSSGQTNVPGGLTDVVAVSGGMNHTLALKADGSVVAWGWSAYGLNTIPAGLAGVVAVSAGEFHNMALKADGTVIVWGDRIQVPPELRDVVAISAGTFGSAAITSDGRAEVWPVEAAYGMGAVPAGANDLIAVAAGASHVLGIRNNGSALGWGGGIPSDATVPADLGPVVALDAGHYFSVGLKADGRVTAWGVNSAGQSSPPAGMSNIVMISAGRDFALALRQDGAVLGWGSDFSGQVAGVAALSRVAAISAGGYHGVALVAPAPPGIHTQPASQTITAGLAAQFSVGATSGSALTYQWRKDGVALPGATAAALTISPVALTDAGNYDVIVSGAGGNVTSNVAALTVVNPVPPAIAAQPGSRAAVAGQPTTLTVSATGSPPLRYQWYKDGVPVTGATLASLTFAPTQPGDAGTYRVVVTNSAGNVASGDILLVLSEQAVAGSGYIPGGSVRIVNTLYHGGGASGLRWEVLLPAGWTVAGMGGAQADSGPAIGTGSVAEWVWTGQPPTPLQFEYTLNVPAAETGEKDLAARVVLQRPAPATALEALAFPDPLRIQPGLHHAADTNRDSLIGLTELTRVIELYNTRTGTTRTGAYAVATESGEDGFRSVPTRGANETAGLTRYHSADSNRDGRISLGELTRIIELYNVRAGTVRTGQYHVQPGTEDGFAPGP